jgi:hypothetical protein
VFSRRYAKSYLKGITGRFRLRTEQDSEEGGQYRITGEKELLRIVQEPEYRTEKITSLVYAV